MTRRGTEFELKSIESIESSACERGSSSLLERRADFPRVFNVWQWAHNITPLCKPGVYSCPVCVYGSHTVEHMGACDRDLFCHQNLRILGDCIFCFLCSWRELHASILHGITLSCRGKGAQRGRLTDAWASGVYPVNLDHEMCCIRSHVSQKLPCLCAFLVCRVILLPCRVVKGARQQGLTHVSVKRRERASGSWPQSMPPPTTGWPREWVRECMS